MMKILLTGGLGYIGSHIVAVLINRGYEVVIIDNLSNSKIEVLGRLKAICGVIPDFIEGDIRDQTLLESIIQKHHITAVMHLAGLKAVGESTQEPLKYYDNNVAGTIALLKAMQLHGLKRLVFSSSATVYGVPQYLPLDEDHPTNPESPYGKSKLKIEKMLEDLAKSDNSWKITVLRYFNPVGAHESGLIGEAPNGMPNNLMPIISLVAAGKLNKLKVFGNDYNTLDGTCIRDYIHVMDLAEGHVCALNYLYMNTSKFSILNLGTGAGCSVFELLRFYEEVTGKNIKYEIVPRRAGDVDVCYANTKKANLILGWYSKRNLRQMCEDSWRWQNLFSS